MLLRGKTEKILASAWYAPVPFVAQAFLSCSPLTWDFGEDCAAALGFVPVRIAWVACVTPARLPSAPEFTLTYSTRPPLALASSMSSQVSRRVRGLSCGCDLFVICVDNGQPAAQSNTCWHGNALSTPN